MGVPYKTAIILPRYSDGPAIRQPFVLSAVFRRVQEFHSLSLQPGSIFENGLLVPIVYEALVLRTGHSAECARLMRQ